MTKYAYLVDDVVRNVVIADADWISNQPGDWRLALSGLSKGGIWVSGSVPTRPNKETPIEARDRMIKEVRTASFQAFEGLLGHIHPEERRQWEKLREEISAVSGGTSPSSKFLIEAAKASGYPPGQYKRYVDEVVLPKLELMDARGGYFASRRGALEREILAIDIEAEDALSQLASIDLGFEPPTGD